MSIHSDLASFYNTEAKKYHQTRKKYRPDGQRILKVLDKLGLKNPKLLELGCWGGRLISLLNAEYQGNFSYTGIDISQGLLNYAKKENPDHEFVCADMLSFLTSVKQESLDAVLACASFQHLPSEAERLAVMKNAYRALNYGGVLIFTNWAFSERFLKTHWLIFLRSAFASFFSFGKRTWRDVFIPWKSKNETHYRYYHLFALEELKKLAEMSGFLVEELVYVDKKGKITHDWKQANNSFLLAKKEVCKPS